MAQVGLVVDAREVLEFAVQLDSAGKIAIPTAVAGVVRTYGQLARTQVLANASTGYHAPGEPHIPGTGPGPNVASSDYIRSWDVEYQFAPAYGVFVAMIGTNNPQGRRLEFGFYDMSDVLGRRFFQPPFPHAGPALDQIAEPFTAALEAAAGGSIARL